MDNRLLVICVNYNSYSELQNYLKSIDLAAKEFASYKVDVAVVDNTTENIQNVNIDYNYINVLLYPFHENLGYLGGAIKALENIGKDTYLKYNHVVISNVDVSLSSTFLEKLFLVKDENIGWIVPKIIRKYDNSNENPFMIERPSKLKLQTLCFIYKHPLLFRLLNWYSIKKHTQSVDTKLEHVQEIYAGMGSIFILSQSFMNKIGNLYFSAFMYGEEIHIAELVRKFQLKTVYIPDITVYDICGVSTGKLNISKKCEMMYEGIHKMLLEHFN